MHCAVLVNGRPGILGIMSAHHTAPKWRALHGYAEMDAYQSEYWDRIMPVSFSLVRGLVVSDYGLSVAHGSPWALETW